MSRLAFLLLLLAFTQTAQAANKPCSGKKGGISHCQGALFICNDGSASQSKQTCSAEDAPSKPKKKKKDS
jgi:hypothetical protein